jgi:hypothetical protein
MYLNRYGRLSKITGWRRWSDRLKGFLGGLRTGRIDPLSDHSMFEYIDAIFDAVLDESRK